MSLFDLDEPIRKVSTEAQKKRTTRDNVRYRAEEFYQKAREKGVSQYESEKAKRIRDRLQRAKKLNEAIRAKEKSAQVAARKLRPGRAILRFFVGKKTKGMSFLERSPRFGLR